MSNFFNSGISTETFLAEYWQQKPLLIRNAFTDLRNPLSPTELAGLACEEGSNARLVLEQCDNQKWCVEYGPFDPQRFSTLPETGWSLLVSDVERVIPDVLDIQRQFRCIPDWRLDDVMFSYAPAGGSVGAHIDAYDVFLLQTHGTRRWMIAEHYTAEFLDNTDLEILKTFSAEQEWELHPGDMLYLPPNIAHHGVAVDACMTCSIGFRAPSSHDMAHALIDHLLQTKTAQRYSDAGTAQQLHAAEITPSSLLRIRELLSDITHFDDATLMQWFGEYISDAKSQLHCADEPTQHYSQETLAAIDEDRVLTHNPLCRFFFSTDKDDTALLFVNGESFDVSQNFAQMLCADTHCPLAKLKAATATTVDSNCLVYLLNQGWLEIQ